MREGIAIRAVLLLFVVLCTSSAIGGAYGHNDNQDHSDSLLGTLGLNTIPSARMDAPGTIKAGTATLDPYLHGFIGFQIATPLYVQLRQSAETSHLRDDPDRLYPGIDFKLRLLTENRSRPEISFGAQSAIGHKRMAGEYLALSKRWGDFDVTGGIGWGRFGSAGHLPNPLKGVLSHFGSERALDGENPSGPSDWLSGDTVGLFGGVEYALPLVKNLALKLDYGSDAYSAERALSDFHAPARWSAGLAYRPFDFLDVGLGVQGTDKIMGRVTLRAPTQIWLDSDERALEPLHVRAKRTGTADPKGAEVEAQGSDLSLSGIQTHGADMRADLRLWRGLSTPLQIGRAAIPMINHGGRETERLIFQPTVMNLRGPRLSLQRADLERALSQHNSSASEIWKNAEIIPDRDFTWRPRLNDPRIINSGAFSLALQTQASLSEEDSGILYRTSLVAGHTRSVNAYLHGTLGLRMNAKDNLAHLQDFRWPALLPVRSDVDAFAARGLALDQSFISFTHSLRSDMHLAISSGYLEEMYGGFGGEFLYRPYDSRFAAGVEVWQAFKRDPYTFMNLGFNGDHLLTGHMNLWYDLPTCDVTLHLRAGRYLAEDVGGTFGLEKIWPNGVKLAAQTTITDQADFDLFGERTHAAHEIRLTLPLGRFSALPLNSRIESTFAPFGRDTGQSLENPVSLYDLTEAFSARHLEAQWTDILSAKEE